MAYFPIFLDCHRMHALVVGGGGMAGAKIESLVAHGARVTVVARKVGERVRTVSAAHDVALLERAYETADLAGKTLVVVAISGAAQSRRIAAEARRHGLLVNVVDNPALCDFIFPALIRRGPLQVAVSSGGISPVLARLVKQAIELAMPKRLDALITFADTKRQTVRRHLNALQPRRLFWERVFRGPVAAAVMEGQAREAERQFAHLLAGAPATPRAALFLIGAGAGDAGTVSRETVRLLSQADTIFHDPRVDAALLDQFARRDAPKIAIGTRQAGHGAAAPVDLLTQLEDCWRRHAIVAVLQYGAPDADVPAVGLARRLGIPVEITNAPGAAGAPSASAGDTWFHDDQALGGR